VEQGFGILEGNKYFPLLLSFSSVSCTLIGLVGHRSTAIVAGHNGVHTTVIFESRQVQTFNPLDIPRASRSRRQQFTPCDRLTFTGSVLRYALRIMSTVVSVVR